MSPQQPPLLEFNNVNSYYGNIQVHFDINLKLYEGEMTCLLGGNASGKSTTLKTILGEVVPRSGSVTFQGERIDGLPTRQIVKRGISIVPENRRIFPRLTVMENLHAGAYQRNDKAGIKEDLEHVFELFPRLKERASQYGVTLSGGEQQMLAIGRALMSRPKLILMDEPSMGLAPALVETVFEIIQTINEVGVAVFVVEQNANMALSIANRGYVIQKGHIVLADTAGNLLKNKLMQQAYLGVTDTSAEEQDLVFEEVMFNGEERQ